MVTLSNHDYRDSSHEGTTLERFPIDSHGPSTIDSTLTQPTGWHLLRQMAQHGAPTQGHWLHRQAVNANPSTSKVQQRNPNNSSTQSPAQHVASCQLAHQPHPDSLILRFPDLRIGHAVVGPQCANQSNKCPTHGQPHKTTQRSLCR